MPTINPTDDKACDALLASGMVAATRVPAIVGPGECGISAPVSLQSIVLPDQRRIALKPTPTIRCDLAMIVSRWVIEDVEPILSQQHLQLEGLENADAYSCRGRNRIPGAMMSEHARGNAIDFDAFIFAKGRRIELTGADASPFAKLIRASACARFATVLGPGSDAFHQNHIHLDLEPRRNNASLCQWRID